jgi:signal transduction histidine kinase
VDRERKDLVALYNIAVAVGSSLNLKEVIWRLYKEASRSVGPSNFAIVIYDERADGLTFYLVFDQGHPVKPFALRHSSNRGLISRILNNKKSLLVDDLTKTNYYFEINRLHPNKPVRSWLGVPFHNGNLARDSAQGVIAVWSYRPRAFSQRDLWFFSEVGQQAAIAIRNANLFESSQRRLVEMSVVNEVAKTLSSTLDVDEVLHRIMAQVEATFNVGAGFLLFRDPHTDDLIYQIGMGEQANNIRPFRIPKGKGVAGRVAELGKPLMVERKKYPLDFNARNVLCVPLILHNQVMGVLEVVNKKEGRFTRHDLELLNSIASFAGIAIENARLHESVLDERDRVIMAEEQARKDLARDLHDGPVQLIAGVTMRLDYCLRVLEENPAELRHEMPQALQMSERAVHQMRTAIFELRPLILETEGLEPALDTFIKRLQQDLADQPAPQLTLSIEADNPQGHLTRQDAKVEAAIFSIIQEAVSNALKHADASQVGVQLKETNTALYVSVADDGRGFDVDKVTNHYGQRGSLGLVNIRERAELIGGDQVVRSVPGRGTRVRVFIPKSTLARRKQRTQSGILSNAKRVQTDMLTKVLTQTGQLNGNPRSDR